MIKQGLMMVFVCGLVFVMSFTSVALAASELNTLPSDVATEEKLAFSYNPAGRREPFKPLIGLPDNNPGDPFLPEPGPGPLEKHDLHQFQVIGIILGELGDYARVLAPNGKSYTIKVGTPIGMFQGSVISISDNVVLVREIKRFDDNGNIVVKEPETSLYLNPINTPPRPEGTLFLLSKI